MIEALITLAISFTAISILIGLNVLLGGWTPSTIDTLETAAELAREEAPGFVSGDGVLAADKRAAIILSLDQETVALVSARGSRFVARPFARGAISRATPHDDGRLSLRIDDFTHPAIMVRLNSGDEARAWAQRLSGGED